MGNRETIRQLEAMFGQEENPVQKEHLNQTIQLAAARYRTCRKPGTGLLRYILWEFCYTGRYMGLWQVLQALAVFAVMEILFAGHFLRLLEPRHVPFVLCCAAFTAAWSFVLVLYRSSRYKMWEVEAAARFSGGKRLVVQLIVMVSIESVILLLLFAVTRIRFGVYPGMAAVYIFIPYMAGIAVLMYCLRHISVSRTVKCFGVIWVFAICILALLYKFFPAFYQGNVNIYCAAAGGLLVAAFVMQGAGIWRGGYVPEWAE